MYKYLTLLLLSITLTSQAQWNPNATSDTEVNADVSAAVEVFKSNPNLKPFFEQAHGYAVFPSIKKAGFGIGGATGKGQVFEKGNLIGNTKVTQLSLGLQFGGQAFKEIIFFKDIQALDRFTRGNFEFGAVQKNTKLADLEIYRKIPKMSIWMYLVAKIGVDNTAENEPI